MDYTRTQMERLAAKVNAAFGAELARVQYTVAARRRDIQSSDTDFFILRVSPSNATAGRMSQSLKDKIEHVGKEVIGEEFIWDNGVEYKVSRAAIVAGDTEQSVNSRG